MVADVVRFCHYGRGVIWCDSGSETWLGPATMEGESLGVVVAYVVRSCHYGRGVIWCDGGSVTWYVCCRRDSASCRPPLRASWPTYWASASVWCTTAVEVRGTRTCRNCGQWMRALTSTINRKTNDGDHSHSKVKLERWWCGDDGDGDRWFDSVQV